MTDPTTPQPAIDPGDPPDPRRLNRRDALVAGGGALGLLAVGFGVFGSKFVFPHTCWSTRLRTAPPHSPGRCRRPRPRATTTRPTSTKRAVLRTQHSREDRLRVPGHRGRDLLLRGRVLDTAGVGLAGAVLDFWQANEDGAYDNVGYSYRGHQYTRPDGHTSCGRSCRFRTPSPASGGSPTSTSRCRAHRPGCSTTQLFYDNDPNGYARNVNIDRSLLTAMRSGPGG